MGALVLTRNAGQKIMIGDDIEITVLRVEHGQARLSIDAPRNVAVHREEIYRRIQDQKHLPPEDRG